MVPVRFIIKATKATNLGRVITSLKNQTVQDFVVDVISLKGGVPSTFVGNEKYRAVADITTLPSFSGWTSIVGENDTIREDFVELLLERYSKHDIVIFRMTDGRLTYPKIGSNNLIKTNLKNLSFASKLKFTNNDFTTLSNLISPGIDFAVTDEILYYIGGVQLPRTISELIISKAAYNDLATFYRLIRGGSGISLLSARPNTPSRLMSPCISYLEEALAVADIPVTVITSLIDVVPGTTLLVYLNILVEHGPLSSYATQFPIIIMNTEPREMYRTLRDIENLQAADLVLEYDISEVGLFFPHMFFGSSKYLTEKLNQRYDAIFYGSMSNTRKYLFNYMRECGLGVTNPQIDERSNLEYINKISESKLAPMIPRCRNGIEIHRLSSIICAGCPRVIYYYPYTENRFMTLLSDVVTFSDTPDDFVIKCKDALKYEDLIKKRERDVRWWNTQRLRYLFSDILNYVENKQKYGEREKTIKHEDGGYINKPHSRLFGYYYFKRLGMFLSFILFLLFILLMGFPTNNNKNKNSTNNPRFILLVLLLLIIPLIPAACTVVPYYISCISYEKRHILKKEQNNKIIR